MFKRMPGAIFTLFLNLKPIVLSLEDRLDSANSFWAMH
jgi:hypothetical protein